MYPLGYIWSVAEKKKEKAKRNFSPETRHKLAQLARERHAKGEFGGAEFGKLGGRPRKDRAAKRVAEAAQDPANRQAIIQVFKDAVDGAQPMKTRLAGAEAWLKVEQNEGQLQLREEEVDAKQHSRDELIAILSERLTTGPSANLLRRQIEAEHIPDAEVVEDDGD